MMIFCVEDDRGIRELMTYTLNASGYEALGLKDGKELDEALKSEKPCLITLDIMLPNEDGISILKRLKNDERYHDIPIIMASAKGEEYDKVIGLDLGADDYLAKPFGMMEMVSRIKAVLRRSEVINKKQELRNGPIYLNNIKHIVTMDGKEIELTLKEYELLLLFMNNIGIVFTREHLLASIWDSNFVGESRTIDVHVGTLRNKLGNCGSCIKTLRGVGYKMEAIYEEKDI
ncbi:MAG: response regulator transcription factor [Solobacterium sp.]|nr:response regulator transcription factor [Solobacterium sp.]MDY3793458.1 response regulator transcription factor [Erysipelotrichaceae bacterium]MCI6877968.1 response regulator transcription factor [Solobacterium sp.]MCI7157410.1 response regulator transcription factor [Solobacterium sp.]MCI7446443.1 response regulator transcription factor [Solobacterium sp.]